MNPEKLAWEQFKSDVEFVWLCVDGAIRKVNLDCSKHDCSKAK